MNRNNRIILRVESLKKYFPVRRGFFQRISGWVKAVDGVSFEIEQGKTLGLVGESGCGKTTVARIILKLLEPDEGEIIFRGLDISNFTEKDMKPHRKDMQIVFQDPFGSLNPRMTIGLSIEEGLRILNIKSGKKRKEGLEKLLKMVGMSPESKDRYPHEFSGGQRQRIGIARAIALKPKLIVCDEPVSALDVSIQSQILNLLLELQQEMQIAFIFITHDLAVVKHVSDRIAVMYLGKIVEYTDADSIYEAPVHPYTKTLISAIPVPDPARKNKKQILYGDIPSPANPPKGCRFHTRCPKVENMCRQEEPVLRPIKNSGKATHMVACHLA